MIEDITFFLYYVLQQYLLMFSLSCFHVHENYQPNFKCSCSLAQMQLFTCTNAIVQLHLVVTKAIAIMS